MIKRSTILKLLKQQNKYGREHFTMKKNELEEECKKLGIDITQCAEEPQQKKAVKKKTVIQDPDYSSDDDSEGEEVVSTPTPPPPPKKKKANKKEVVKEVKKLKRRSNEENIPTPHTEDNDKNNHKQNVKEVNEILKDLNRAIRELFDEFDQKHLDIDDIHYVQNEFNLTVNECQDMIDPLVADFSDSEINKIENKIDLQYRKLERFIS
jgi:hypothetical protein